MDRIDGLKSRIALGPQIARLSEAEGSELGREFPGLPAQYIRFLTDIGYGNFGGCQVYGGPTPAGEIFPRLRGSRPRILLFGDDFQGYGFGFAEGDEFALVEVDPRGNVRPLREDFLTFIEAFVTEPD